jgi:hypothetical protein
MWKDDAEINHLEQLQESKSAKEGSEKTGIPAPQTLRLN